MRWIIPIVGILLAAAIVYVVILKLRGRSQNNPEVKLKHELLANPITVQQLSVLDDATEKRMVEVKDEKLLARINTLVPNVVKVASEAKVASSIKDVSKMKDLYQVIIPPGTKLDKSRDIARAARATYRDSKGVIKGQANLIKQGPLVDPATTAASMTNAAMNAASLIVGQYYMSQINNQLEGISSNIESVSEFQNNEYKSKVYALVAEIQKCSTFQMEIMENAELRGRELLRLQNLEHETIQLLGQANLSILDISKKSNAKYEDYEENTEQAEKWINYQKVLIEVLNNIADLSYVFNVGAITKENSRALLEPYKRQSGDATQAIASWHTDNIKIFAIDVDENRRKRQGIKSAPAKLVGLINNDFNYKKIDGEMITKIDHQMNIPEKTSHDVVENDLFSQDANLIVKDGSVYYIPSVSNAD